MGLVNTGGHLLVLSLHLRLGLSLMPLMARLMLPFGCSLFLPLSVLLPF